MIGGQFSEWHWLWDVYVVGGCVAGMTAVVVLDDRFPSNVPLAITALTGLIVWALIAFRRVLRTQEFNWRSVVFVAVAVTLFYIALWAAPAAIAAIPAIYPLIFAPLPLPAALLVTTAVNVTPVMVALALYGTDWPDLPVAIAFTLVGVIIAPIIGTAIMTSMRQRAQLAGLVAELAASRAESARLSREAGVAAERERLAREIHDTLAQGFTSIITLAQAIEPELETDTAAARRHIELIRTTARENLAEARAMVAELTPTALHDGSLPAAIERQCDRLSAETGVAVILRAEDDLPVLGMATDVVLLRAVQEAFANVRKHAQATSVTVNLSSPGDALRLSVSDNGIGFNDERAQGYGLRGMRSRVTQVGGTMSVSPTPGGGTTVTVEVPA
jgi:signal transduction histidine kinase